MRDRAVVLIADRRTGTAPPTLASTDFELVEDEYYREVCDALEAIDTRVVHYQSLSTFMDNVGKHEHDVVLPLWAGQHSRSRKGLVPAICEAYNVAYVGADAYTSIISQDKHLSRALLQDCGLKTAPGWLATNRADLAALGKTAYPAVLKPNFEGGSIGISQDCLVDNSDAARRMIERLWTAHEQPVLVEEFVPGREVSIVIAQTPRKELVEAVELNVGGISLRDTIWSFELKQTDQALVWSAMTRDLAAEDLQRARAVFHRLGRAELLRIDGRLQGSSFTAIELSPDVHLGTNSSVAQAFHEAGYTYPEMFSALLERAAAVHRPRPEDNALIDR
jgi:D-alanine-D-alanine ligase